MVKLGIIGLGKWADVLTTAIKDSSQVKIISAYSRSAKTREKYTQQHQILCTQSAEELVSNPEIQGVILTVPNELHFEYAQLCAAHGKHVYIEKPITNNLKEAKMLRDICAQKQVRVFIGHVAKLLVGVKIIHEEMQKGTLGDICLIEGHFSNERALTLTPDNWRWYEAKAPGGPLSQIAIHQMDVLRYLGGPIQSVSAMSTKKSPVGAEVHDQWLVNLEFENGALGAVISSWTSPGVFEVRVVGTKGLMHYQIDQTKWGTAKHLHEHASLTLQKVGEPYAQQTVYKLPPADMFAEEIELFARMIQGEALPNFDAQYGVEILGLVEAARLSAAQDSVKVKFSEFLFNT